MSDIRKLAIHLNESLAEGAPGPLDLETIYGEDHETIDRAVEFVFDACGSRSWDVLNEAWKNADVTRMRASVMIALLTMSHMHDPSFFPERTGYAARCRVELTRRGNTDEEITAMLRGLE